MSPTLHCRDGTNVPVEFSRPIVHLNLLEFTRINQVLVTTVIIGLQLVNILSTKIIFIWRKLSIYQVTQCLINRMQNFIQPERLIQPDTASIFPYSHLSVCCCWSLCPFFKLQILGLSMFHF